MDITEASKRTNCPDERQDLMDDHLLHREDEEKVVEQNAEDTLTNDIEKDPPRVRARARRVNPTITVILSPFSINFTKPPENIISWKVFIFFEMLV